MMLGGQRHADGHTTSKADVLGDLRPHGIGDDDLVASVEQSAERDIERVHGAVGNEYVVGGRTR